MATNNLFSSKEEAGEASLHMIHSNEQTGNAPLHMFSSNDGTGEASLHMFHSNEQIGNAPLHMLSSNVGTGEAPLHMFHSNEQSSNALLQNIIPSTETSFDINKLNNSFFKQKITPLMFKCSRDTIQNAVKIMVELYKNPKQSHAALMKLTQLSTGGLAKHIMMLKKRGFIYRIAFQEYKLTDLVLGLMKESMG